MIPPHPQPRLAEDLDALEMAAAWLARRLGGDGAGRAAVAVVAGSGLNGLAATGRLVAAVPYAEIPGLAPCRVAGHAGEWQLRELAGRHVHCLCGRLHAYEGYDFRAVTWAMRLLARLGTRCIVLTNAAGGLTARLRPGDLLLIRDHLNFIPGLTAASWPESTPPADRLRALYDESLNASLRTAAAQEGLELKEGIYAAVLGPNYETRAEVRAFARLGAEAVGMSTAPEALAAAASGLRVSALSLITNSHAAAGPPPTHAEVLRVAVAGGERLGRLLARWLHDTINNWP